VSNISPDSSLHTYVGTTTAAAVTYLKDLGIRVKGYPSGAGIAFAYFHPLSQPHIEPPVQAIMKQPPIAVSGKAVLRFGFLEGDAVVKAQRAVYDPQNYAPVDFYANGSIADELAVVLNESELYALSGKGSIADGVACILQNPHVLAAVVKRGTQGAEVFERGKECSHVPAYRSTKVFKIGTGDVFSAIFAHYWSEKLLSPHEAANIASKAVADYASSKTLPVSHKLSENLTAIGSAPPRPVQLVGTTNGIGRRYVMEEARFRLRELGAHVISDVFDDLESPQAHSAPGAMLAVSEGLSHELQTQILRAHSDLLPIVILAEHNTGQIFSSLVSRKFIVTDDFSSALYLAIWSAIPDGV
jgi:hypothetical protein